MKNINELSNSFDITLKESELQNVSTDLIEVFGDAFLKDGILKEIPILGSIIGIAKTTINVHDRLFLKKMIYFLSELSSISQSERLKQIKKIEDSDDYRIKVGEKLLYIVDKCEDHLKAEFVGKLFKSYLEEKISYIEFLKCSSAVENLFYSDIIDFINYRGTKSPIESASKYISVGLMDIRFVAPKMRDLGRLYIEPKGTKTEFKPGEMCAIISLLGNSFKKALQNS